MARRSLAPTVPEISCAAFGELEAEIERPEAKRQAHDPADIPRCGAFVILNDGTVRIGGFWGAKRTFVKNVKVR
ncbi:MAG TPA: hypothetical protein VK635_23700 [Bradyrhizobium sp.]|nr:hypothetical protein [Bradyrhizobium sp.]